LVEKIRLSREKHRPDASHWQTLSHNVVSSTTRHERPGLVVIDIDCFGSCNPTTIRSRQQQETLIDFVFYANLSNIFWHKTTGITIKLMFNVYANEKTDYHITNNWNIVDLNNDHVNLRLSNENIATKPLTASSISR
jgi:hypothetical protein